MRIFDDDFFCAVQEIYFPLDRCILGGAILNSAIDVACFGGGQNLYLAMCE